MQLPDGIEKLLPAKVIEKVYDDVASAPAKEASKIVVDLVKTARLFLAPIQLAATFQDRFERLLERVRNRVPEQRQIPAPAEVVGPAIKQMRYLDDSSIHTSTSSALLNGQYTSKTLSLMTKDARQESVDTAPCDLLISESCSFQRAFPKKGFTLFKVLLRKYNVSGPISQQVAVRCLTSSISILLKFL